MADEMDRKDIEAKLWSAITDTRTGMLGLTGAEADHFQPMTAYVEADARTIWFYTRRDNDLLRRAAGGGRAMFNLVGKDHHVFACLAGEITEQHDRERIDRYWNPVVAAWFPEGKDDPELTLIRFDVDDAQVWISQKGPVRFAYEIAKANMTKSEPDVGDSTHLQFH